MRYAILSVISSLFREAPSKWLELCPSTFMIEKSKLKFAAATVSSFVADARAPVILLREDEDMAATALLKDVLVRGV
jgi:hypothetical protein